MGNRNDNVYFANLQGQEYLDALKEKVNDYRDYCGSSGLKARWSISMGAYYGLSADGKNSWQISPGGEFGEMNQMKVNDYANLVRHQLVLAIQNRPAGMAKAINMDSDTLRDSRIGTQLIEYYLSDPEHTFENDYVQALELALLSAEAFLVQDWDTGLGDEIRPDEQNKPIKSGDIKQTVFPVWNAARDLGMTDPDKAPWFIFSDRVNKFDLAAKFPAYEDEILTEAKDSSELRQPLLFRATTDKTDYIERHWLIHPPSPACPKGRYTRFINSTVIQDNEFPYKKKNYYRCSDREMFETPFGHTANYDLLALEQMTDMFWSTALTALATFGVSTIVGPKGGGIAHQQLGKGMRYIEMDPNLVDKIRPLDLAKLPDALVPLLEMSGNKKDELSGINSIIKGDPEGALKAASGAAMALLQSQSITFNSGIQRAFYRLLSAGGTGMIQFFQQFADSERIFRIAGKVNQQAVQEFKFDSTTMDSISTVIFEPINPILQTASGKLSVAETLMQKGALTDPHDYIEVLTTGNLNIVTNKANTLKEAILQENEELMDGKPVKAIITENHENHIAAHQIVISTPNAKQDPNLVNNVLSHIQEHISLWQQASISNPQLLLATGQKVLPPMPPPGQPQAPGPQGPPPGAHPGGGVPAHNGHTMNPVPQGQQQAAKVNPSGLPHPPTNPATGEPAPVAPGTAVA